MEALALELLSDWLSIWGILLALSSTQSHVSQANVNASGILSDDTYVRLKDEPHANKVGWSTGVGLAVSIV